MESRTHIITLVAVVFTTQLAAIALFFALTDPAGCRDDLRILQAKHDRMVEEIQQLYRERGASN